MLINETVVLIDSIDLFRNYVVVKNLFIAVGFVNKAFLSLLGEQFCFCFNVARLPTATVRVFFLSNFLKKETFFFLLPASRNCLMHQQDFFWIFSFSQSRKILYKFSNLSAILKHRGKNFVMSDVNRAFVL